MPEPTLLASMAPGLAVGAANQIGGMIGQKRSYKYAKRFAAFQHSKNMELLKYQLDYNTPAAQMQRFRDAGLNENLIYGQGDAGNWSGSRPEYPNIQPPDFSFMATMGTQVAQAQLMKNQADLTAVKVDESSVKQELNRAQTDLIRANPYLDPVYLKSVVRIMENTAALKRQETNFMLSEFNPDTKWTHTGHVKMQKELDLLVQRFNLGNVDAKIKAEIIKTKEFQNAIQEVNAKFMQDGEITPQLIYNFISQFFLKLMPTIPMK